MVSTSDEDCIFNFHYDVHELTLVKLFLRRGRVRTRPETIQENFATEEHIRDMSINAISR